MLQENDRSRGLNAEGKPTMPLGRLAIPNAAAQSRNHQEIHQSKHDEER